MADIVLLDRNDTQGIHRGVNRLRVPNTAGGMDIFETPFSMEDTYFYYLRSTGTEGEYLVIEKSLQSGGSTGKLCVLSDTYCQTNGYQSSGGQYVIAVLVSKNPSFTAGNVYSLDTLLNG